MALKDQEGQADRVDADRSPLVVSYHTPGPYAEEARRLRCSLGALGLPHAVRCVPDRKGWQANAAWKADFLLLCIRQWPERALLYVDADAVVHSDPFPYLQQLDCDVAVHYLRRRELLSGTIWLPECRRLTERLILAWVNANARRVPSQPQRNLALAIAGIPELRVARLPPEYCYIFDIGRRLHPEVEPVIEHLQASRAYRSASSGPGSPALRRRIARLEQLSAGRCRARTMPTDCGPSDAGGVGK